jgi:hypothetical protein
MNKRMKKDELLKLIESLKIDKNEFWILSSGALVLRGIYDDAGDLDIAVTNKGLEELKKNYNLIRKENGWYIVNDEVECVCDGDKDKLEYKPEYNGEYYLQNINEYYEYLKQSSRDKDKVRIPIVENYIKNKIDFK